MTKNIVVLGSTGSIGVNTLDLVRRMDKRAGQKGAAFRIWGLSAHANLERLKEQIIAVHPKYVAVTHPETAVRLKHWAKRRAPRLIITEGADGMKLLVQNREVDLVVSGIVGSAGLLPLIHALKAGKKVALANKEALIVAGDLVMRTARKYGATIIPVDSEHSAIFQCLHSGRPLAEVRRLILTASGGAFYRRAGSLDRVTPREALDHPTWKMGKKITVDCATLTNKGLEAIEAHHLFGVPMDKIEVVVHPQSIVHSLVEFADGAMLAQLSHPDMRLPIQYALTHPGRLPTPIKTLELAQVGKLEFLKPDFGRFPCLAMAFAAGRAGGLWPAVFSGANEVAVAGFLSGKTTFLGIARLLKQVMAAFKTSAIRKDLRQVSAEKNEASALEAVLAADAWARQKAAAQLS
jgi:1-deoxy-D-xylulose-5-phosphate reductoisomerase